MKTKRNAAPARARIPGRGRELSELRRRSGPHGRFRPGRGSARRRAIEDALRT